MFTALDFRLWATRTVGFEGSFGILSWQDEKAHAIRSGVIFRILDGPQTDFSVEGGFLLVRKTKMPDGVPAVVGHPYGWFVGPPALHPLLLVGLEHCLKEGLIIDLEIGLLTEDPWPYFLQPVLFTLYLRKMIGISLYL